MNKIFVIGFPKSGTSSIHVSLTSVGISSIHWGTDKIFVGTSIQKSKNEQRPLLSEIDSYQAFAQMETCIDDRRCYWPQLIDVPVLEQQYPGSVFIFNDRNINNWLRSLHNWNITHGPIRKKEESLIERIIRLDIPGLPAGVGRYDQELKKWYIQHKNNMLDFFSNKNNFLLFDIEKDNENKLKKFLDIPNMSWVHKNKSWTTHKGQIL